MGHRRQGVPQHDSDRCRDQPRQLRRPPTELQGRGHRNQHHHQHHNRCQQWSRFCHPLQHRSLVADQLIANGKVIRAYLGLTPENLKPFEVKKFGVQQGTVVRNVEEGSAAAKAGIKPGDIITEIQGRRIRGEQDLRDAMLIHKPGTSVIIKYIRSGKVQTVSVQLTGRPDLLAQTEERTAPP
ncbi:MAG: hypothetical protein C4340_01605, partial [Armatimonadota bacterium]